MFKYKLAILVFIELFLRISAVTEKVHLAIFYEALCPDSENFFREQFLKGYSSLGDYLDLTFIPFGKSDSFKNETGVYFTCQHGPEECHLNRMQSCVLSQTKNQAQQAGFVHCQMSTPNKYSIKECAAEFHLNPNIDDCMNSVMGTELQLQAEYATKYFKPKFIPMLSYDFGFDQFLQDNSLKDFHTTLCIILGYRQIALTGNACEYVSGESNDDD